MTDLHQLTIAAKRGASIKFLFNSEAGAKLAYGNLKQWRPPESFEADRGLPGPVWTPECEVTDSYGNTAQIDRSEILFLWVTDLGREFEGQKDLAMMTEHAKQSLQKRMQMDGAKPELIRAMPFPSKPS